MCRQLEKAEISAAEIIASNDGIIHRKYLINNGLLVRYALPLIADALEGDHFKLTYRKVVKSIAYAMLAIKGDFELSEYI